MVSNNILNINVLYYSLHKIHTLSFSRLKKRRYCFFNRPVQDPVPSTSPSY